MSWAIAAFVIEWIVRIGFAIRVISKRSNVSESLAWIGVLLVFPLGGVLLYLWFGEKIVGTRRRQSLERVLPQVGRWIQDVNPRSIRTWPAAMAEEQALSQLVRSTVGVPALSGNDLVLFESVEALTRSMVDDIRAARTSCYLEFYIWEEGGITDQLVDALIVAAARGVDCRVLVDALGSRSFLKSQSCHRLKEHNVPVRSALPVGPIRSIFRRFDLRLHRKIVVIDETIGYTGSQNMADPKLFKASAGVGQWVDAMARIEGEASEALLAIFLADWQIETGTGIDQLERAMKVTPSPDQQGAIVQVIPTGPTSEPDVAKQIVISTLFSAKKQLILTTPYYVPDQSLQMALVSAARRGVDVTLIVPRKVDSKLVSLASSPYQVDLIAAGARVLLYEGGLLHTKSITVDDGISLFGSLNLDLRSLQLNFEITLAVYDHSFTRRLRRLQQSYMRHSSEKKQLPRDSAPRRLLENSARLLAPLL